MARSMQFGIESNRSVLSPARANCNPIAASKSHRTYIHANRSRNPQNDASAAPGSSASQRCLHTPTMRVALLCIVVAHASALGRKKRAGPSVTVAAVLAVDKKAVSKGDALFKKRTAASCDAAAKLYEAELEPTRPY